MSQGVRRQDYRRIGQPCGPLFLEVGIYIAAGALAERNEQRAADTSGLRRALRFSGDIRVLRILT